MHGIGALASLHVLLPLPSELGVAGLEQGLNEAIMQLAEAARLESREATLGELLNPGDLLPKLMGKLNSQLALLGLALGESEEKSLTKALGSLDLDQLVGSLLSTTKEPAQLTGLSNLAGGLFEEIGPGSVKGLLGSTLGGKFQPTTVEAVAEELGSSSEAVSGELGETAAQLPAGATMLTAPLTKGGVMGIAPAAKGLALGLLRSVSSEGTSGESGKEGAGGNGSGGGTKALGQAAARGAQAVPAQVARVAPVAPVARAARAPKARAAPGDWGQMRPAGRRLWS